MKKSGHFPETTLCQTVVPKSSNRRRIFFENDKMRFVFRDSVPERASNDVKRFNTLSFPDLSDEEPRSKPTHLDGWYRNRDDLCQYWGLSGCNHHLCECCGGSGIACGDWETVGLIPTALPENSANHSEGTRSSRFPLAIPMLNLKCSCRVLPFFCG